jgi:hypothetical protein
MTKEIKDKPKYQVTVTEDFVGYSDYWSGHGHAFDEETLACMVVPVFVSPHYNEKIGEMIDNFIREVNMWDIQYYLEAKDNEEMQDEISSFLTDEVLTEAFKADMPKGTRKNMFYFSNGTRCINDDEEIDEENDESPLVYYIVHVTKAE